MIIMCIARGLSLRRPTEGAMNQSWSSQFHGNKSNLKLVQGGAGFGGFWELSLPLYKKKGRKFNVKREEKKKKKLFQNSKMKAFLDRVIS